MRGIDIDVLDEALRAYDGLCDLVLAQEARDMHLVNPNNLWFLLELVRQRFADARATADA